MTFYTAISEYYDQLFPLNQAQVRFTSQFLVPGLISQRILDLGCATGKLAIALAENHWQVEGIDSDPTMIRMARERVKGGLPVQFHQLDMMEAGGFFSDRSFQIVLCFGNTLAHLPGLDQMRQLFRQTYRLLEQEGSFLIQVVNYDHVLSDRVTELPPIDRDQVRFIRKYEHRDRQIKFTASLEIKAQHKTLTNEIMLYPITTGELQNLLTEEGFRDLQFYSNFNGDAYQEEGMGLVVSGRK